MTQPDPTVVQLPDAHFPVLNRVLSSPPFPAEGVRPEDQQPLVWTMGETHPLLADFKVVRMFIVPDVGVEVYAARGDGKLGIRNTLPWAMVRLAEEAMDPPSFAGEIADAEAAGEDSPPAASTGATPNANGAAAS